MPALRVQIPQVQKDIEKSEKAEKTAEKDEQKQNEQLSEIKDQLKRKIDDKFMDFESRVQKNAMSDKTKIQQMQDKFTVQLGTEEERVKSSVNGAFADVRNNINENSAGFMVASNALFDEMGQIKTIMNDDEKSMQGSMDALETLKVLSKDTATDEKEKMDETTNKAVEYVKDEEAAITQALDKEKESIVEMDAKERESAQEKVKKSEEDIKALIEEYNLNFNQQKGNTDRTLETSKENLQHQIAGTKQATLDLEKEAENLGEEIPTAEKYVTAQSDSVKEYYQKIAGELASGKQAV